MSDSKGTKRTLACALKELMNLRPFEKISVGDICQQCGVSRKSFYYHFQDKYDLMNWIFYTEFIAMLQQLPQLDLKQFLLNICGYFFDEQIFYRNALSVRGQNCFQDYFIDTIQPFVFMLLQELFAQKENILFLSTFYTDALLAALVRWLNEISPAPVEEFAMLLLEAVCVSSDI